MKKKTYHAVLFSLTTLIASSTAYGSNKIIFDDEDSGNPVKCIIPREPVLPLESDSLRSSGINTPYEYEDTYFDCSSPEGFMHNCFSFRTVGLYVASLTPLLLCAIPCAEGELFGCLLAKQTSLIALPICSLVLFTGYNLLKSYPPTRKKMPCGI